jgi:hypothetical protein
MFFLLFISNFVSKLHFRLRIAVRGLAFGRESPQELSRLNVSPPDAKPVLAVRHF